MASRESRCPLRAQAIHELLNRIRTLTFMPVIVDAHYGRAIAGTEALDFEERELPCLVGLAGRDAERLRQFLGHALGAHQRARQRAADLHHVLADRTRV